MVGGDGLRRRRIFRSLRLAQENLVERAEHVSGFGFRSCML